MIRKLLDWAVHNPILVLLAAGALVIIGGYAFLNVNVEAYPDPAPPIIEVVAIDPGASAEEVERQVTIPLEVALSGMPGLQVTRTRSCFGLAHVRAQFTYARDYEQAKQDVINRLANVNLPPTVQPMISPASPIGEIFRYTFSVPRDAKGGLIYSWADIKSLQDYLVQRELLRVPRIGGVVSSGGLIKRYEIQPDPDRLFQYGISLAQMQKAVGDSNGNGSGDNLTLGQANLVVRSLGLYGDGEDPMLQVLGWSDPAEAAAYLRAEETRRVREIRQTVVASVNNVPIRVDHLVDGGPLLTTDGAAKVSTTVKSRPVGSDAANRLGCTSTRSGGVNVPGTSEPATDCFIDGRFVARLEIVSSQNQVAALRRLSGGAVSEPVKGWLLICSGFRL